MTFIFREITDDDLDLLFASPDVKEALYGMFSSRQTARYMIDFSWRVAVIEATGEMIFTLGDFSVLRGRIATLRLSV